MFLKERITYVRFYLNEDHYRTPVNMDEFVRYNWRNMLEANFNNSKIYDVWLETFCRNYNRYPHIKALSLSTFFKSSSMQSIHYFQKVNA